MGKRFKPYNPDQSLLMPPSLTGIAHMASRRRDSSRLSVSIRQRQGSVKTFSSKILHLNLA